MNIAVKVPLAIAIAILFSIIPLPVTVGFYRPDLLLIVVLFIQCCLPQYFRVTWVFLLGVFLDVLYAGTLGQHALAIIITTWIANNRSSNFKHYSILQQMSVVTIFVVAHQAVLYLTNVFFGYTVDMRAYVITTFISVLFWPCLKILFATRPDSQYAPI